ERDPQRFGQALHSQLAHQIGAMDLDRSWTDVEVVADRFVRKALCEAVEHFTFARREQLQFDGRFVRLLAIRGRMIQASKTLFDRAEQNRLLEWLLDEIDCSGFPRSTRQNDGSVAPDN